MKNWQKLRILIVLFQVCGNKSLDDGKKIHYKEQKEKKGCKEKIAPYIINPMNKYKIIWDSIISVIYLLSYIMDPIIFAFKYEPFASESVYQFTMIVTYIIILDIMLVPFSGTPKDENDIPLNKKKRKEMK